MRCKDIKKYFDANRKITVLHRKNSFASGFFIDISFYFCLSIVIDEKKLDLFTLDLQKTAPFTIVLMQLPCN